MRWLIFAKWNLKIFFIPQKKILVTLHTALLLGAYNLENKSILFFIMKKKNHTYLSNFIVDIFDISNFDYIELIQFVFWNIKRLLQIRCRYVQGPCKKYQSKKQLSLYTANSYSTYMLIINNSRLSGRFATIYYFNWEHFHNLTITKKVCEFYKKLISWIFKIKKTNFFWG